MKRQIAWLRHLLRAKGRHGTHSPFVYAFVEKVLRTRRSYGFLEPLPGISVAEQSLLLNTIAFLGTRQIIFYHSSLRVLHNTILRNFPEMHFRSREDTVAAAGPDTLLLADALLLDTRDAVFMPSFLDIQPSASGLYLFHHAGMPAAKYREMISWPYRMSLDFWSGMLLYQHTDFKEKQHFLLK